MKQIKLTKMKKIMLASVLLILTILISSFAINSNAETTATLKNLEDEKSLVKMTASLSRASDENNVVDIDTLTEQLNKYAGSGVASVSEESSDTLKVTFLASGREYKIDINTGIMIDNVDIELPTTETTTPYLPTGFTPVSGTDLNTGFVIQDGSENQYVWVEVPKTATVYRTAGLNITSFTDAEYTKIENDLHTYTTDYRDGDYSDTYNSNVDHGLTSDEYTTLKQKMLKSVYQNGGFYVGRYETGTATERTYVDRNDTTQTPLIQTNIYPYNNINGAQSQSLASSMASGEYTSSLMFGVQWDLILKYLETKGTTQAELISDSTGWGNYTDELLTTGSSSEYSKQGIYDLAGNMAEWTLETNTNIYTPECLRGGCFYSGRSERRR